MIKDIDKKMGLCKKCIPNPTPLSTYTGGAQPAGLILNLVDQANPGCPYIHVYMYGWIYRWVV